MKRRILRGDMPRLAALAVGQTIDGPVVLAHAYSVPCGGGERDYADEIACGPSETITRLTEGGIDSFATYEVRSK